MQKHLIIFICIVFLACSEKRESEIIPTEVSNNLYAFTFNNKKYEIVKESKTWLDAVAYAVSKGGYLAEVNNEGEQNAIFSELTTKADIVLGNTNNQFGFGAVWLGGNDLQTEGTWLWDGNNDKTSTQFWSGAVDGSPVNGLYNNWGKEPDNNGDQDVLCIGIETTPINTAGKWTDLDGAKNKLYFVIEYD